MTNSFADTTTHPLGQPVEAYECWAVYRDDDGFAASGDLVLCATKELAEQVSEIINTIRHTEPLVETENIVAGSDEEFMRNFTDGYADYGVHATIARKSEIATDLADARRRLLDD